MLTVPEFEEKLRPSPHARIAFRLLVQEGCDPEGLIKVIFQYNLGLSSEERRASLRAGANTLSRWQRLASDLREMANAVDGTIKDVARTGIAEFHFTEKSAPAEAMMSFAEELDAICRLLAPATNAKSGINEPLVFLCYCVKQATREEHYPEIAAILGVFDGNLRMTDQEVKEAADAIRNRVARFKKQWEVIHEKAEEEVAEWKTINKSTVLPSQQPD